MADERVLLHLPLQEGGWAALSLPGRVSKEEWEWIMYLLERLADGHCIKDEKETP